MSGRPKLLDLFCCAGGAAMGYHEAGFDVVGVDIKPQPRYPFEFIQADVMTLDPAFVRSFDAIHASPPCQGYTELRHAPGTIGAPLLIGEIRDRLAAANRPWIIENVRGAASSMIYPLTLCGTMFGLGADGCQLLRHRLIESSFFIPAPGVCRHKGAVIGVYGGHARKRSARHGGRGTQDQWTGGHKAAASEAMGIDWMTLSELSEAIPPAYTRFIGKQLLAHLQSQRLAA